MGNRTFAIIKPNAVAAGNTGKILDHLIRKGFHIRALKMTILDSNRAAQFYSAHRNRPFFPELLEFMTSGPVVVMILEKENAVEDLRILVGDTNPLKASPGTIRNLYGESHTRNTIHASDCDENAVTEWQQFFASDEIVEKDYDFFE